MASVYLCTTSFFFFFLHKSQFNCSPLKGKVECHAAENQLPRAVTNNLQYGLVTQIFITYLLEEFELLSNISQVYGFCTFTGNWTFVLGGSAGSSVGPGSSLPVSVAPFISNLTLGKTFN